MAANEGGATFWFVVHLRYPDKEPREGDCQVGEPRGRDIPELVSWPARAPQAPLRAARGETYTSTKAQHFLLTQHHYKASRDVPSSGISHRFSSGRPPPRHVPPRQPSNVRAACSAGRDRPTSQTCSSAAVAGLLSALHAPK